MKTKLKTIDIKGTPYVTVNSRLKYFREEFIGYKLISEVVSNIDGKCLIKATVFDENTVAVATGHAYEDESVGFINKTSYVENCETSAWGRALGNLGIGIDNEVRSYEEMTTALEGQKSKEARTKGQKYKEFPYAEKETIKKENLVEMLEDCNDINNDVFPLWCLLTKGQQADKEIKEWFNLRKSQIKDAQIG